MKKFLITSFFIFSFLFIGGNTLHAAAPTTKDVFGRGEMQEAFHLSEQTDLFDYTIYKKPDGSGEMEAIGGDYSFRYMVENVINYIKKLLVPVTILFIVWAGTTLILSSGEEEEFDRRKRMVYAAFFGWLILLTAVVLVDYVFFGQTGTIFRKGEGDIVEFAQRGVTELQGLFKYLVTFAVAVGVAFVVFSALKLILAGGEDEAQISNIKKRIVYTAGGMALLVSAEKLVSFFSTKVRNGSDVMMLSTPDIPDTIRFIVDWGNFLLGLIGTISVLMLVWGGVRLIANFGADEQAIDNAKKTLMAAALGLILAFSAWSLMWFFLVH